MPYIDLGSRVASGVSDPNNPIAAGNWTVAFPVNLLAVTVPQFEVYKMIVTGGAPRATFNVYRNNNVWDTSIYAVNNSWDPQQTLKLRFGDSLYFYYSDPATDGFMPTVTIWLQHEASLSLYGS